MTLLSGLTLFVLFSTFGTFSGNAINASAVSASSPTATRSVKTTYNSIVYSTIPGFFKQDSEDTDPTTFDWISENFGLILKTPAGEPDWSTFKKKISDLNAKAAPNERYKVLFLGRHGQGYHNAAESVYGTALWDCFYSLLDGNETARWDDALLTPKGEEEALNAAAAWKTQIKKNVPLPEAYYSSPLRRAASTLVLTFTDILASQFPRKRPQFVEGFRETNGAHTCDRRHTKCYLAEKYPNFTFEPSFSNGDDPLWSPLLRETESQKQARFKVALDAVFGLPSDGKGIVTYGSIKPIPKGPTYVSLTAHSGLISSALKVVGHRPFKLATGAMIPVVVKAEYHEEKIVVKPEPSDVVKLCVAKP